MAGGPERPALTADAMLGRLAKALRMLGYDTSYSADIDDAEIKLAALREGRVLLTRDREIAQTNLAVRVVLVESDRLEEQLVQVVGELGLVPGPGLFTRCLICNVGVEDVPKQEVEGSVPAYVFATQDRFARCPSCGRVYWAATHVEHARMWLRDVLGTRGRAAGDRRTGEPED